MAERLLRTLTFPNLGTYQIQDYNILPRKSLPSAPIHSFADGADNIPVKAMSVDVRAVQSGSGDPSPDNVRPISGWTQAQIVGSGKNLRSSQYSSGSIIQYDEVLRVEFPLEPDTTYTLSFKGTNGNALYVNEAITTSFTEFTVASGRTTVTFTTKSTILSSQHDANGWRLLKNYVAQSSANVFEDLQIELGNSASAYAPYTGKTVTIDFNGTVYGGQLRYVGGKEWEFTPTHVKATYNGDEAWTLQTAATGFNCLTALLDQNSVAYDWATVGDIVCDTYPKASYASTGYNTAQMTSAKVALMSNTGVGNRIAFCVPYTVEEWTAWLANNNVSVVYPLAQPLAPITLTASDEVVTEYGDNTLYCDCGDSSLTYRQDIGLIVGGE